MAKLTLVPPEHFTRDYVETRKQWIGWLEANALDSHEVAIRSDDAPLSIVVDEDAATVTATCFVLVDGQKQAAADGRGALKEVRTVPLLVHPREHGLLAALCSGGVHDFFEEPPYITAWHSGCTFVGQRSQA